jgi:phosphoribosylanthranilate isomerase
MALATIVKVGNISNLSDARYCSGMGVDMLGFAAVEGQDHYLAPKLYQEIRGWVSGPKVVAQIYGISDFQALQSVLEHYVPDYLEMTAQEFFKFENQIQLPSIVSADLESFRNLKNTLGRNIAFVIIDESVLSQIQPLDFPYPILLQVSGSEKLIEKLKSANIKGVVLSGSQETRPGFKDYADLADVLELLEEE